MVINFSMDFLALYITAKILHIKLIPKRLTLAASAGALYSLLALVVIPSGILGASISIGMSFLLTRVSFGKQPAMHLLKNTAVFYLISFALGGGITAICNTLNIWQNKKELVINGSHGVVYGDIPFGLLILLALICGSFSLISGIIAKRKNAVKTAEIKITLASQAACLTGLVDSGNILKEPISGRPVIITTFEAVRKILPLCLIPLFRSGEMTVSTDSAYLSRVRIIPSSTVNGKGLMYAFSPDSVDIDGRSVDVYIAVSGEAEDFGGCPALIPAEII